MAQIKSFLWFSGKVAIALIVAKVANNLIARFTGFDPLGALDDLGSRVA